jgi:tetratricopeptide (TPR) repeat protein
MKKPKWHGCLLSIAVSCILLPAHLAAHSSSPPLLTPDLVEEDNHRGIAKFELGDKQGAILDYNRAITIDPQDAFAYYNRGVAKFELGDKQGAILDYNRAITIDPQDAFAYYNRGVAKFELGDKQGAILDFDRVIAIDPQDAEAYSNRGAVKLALGNKQGAIADLTKGAQLFRQHGNMADYQKIIELIRQAIQIK